MNPFSDTAVDVPCEYIVAKARICGLPQAEQRNGFALPRPGRYIGRLSPLSLRLRGFEDRPYAPCTSVADCFASSSSLNVPINCSLSRSDTELLHATIAFTSCIVYETLSIVYLCLSLILINLLQFLSRLLF